MTSPQNGMTNTSWSSAVHLSPTTRKMAPPTLISESHRLGFSGKTHQAQSSTDNEQASSSTSKEHTDPQHLSSDTYKQVISEIYATLYHFQRERTGVQEACLVDCINKWYDLNAVFENPFTRAGGINSIVNQFSLMSLIPGQIWSELGDICESDDYNGNRVIVFSHTLHFNLLGGSPANQSTDNTSLNTPYTSVPPTPSHNCTNLPDSYPCPSCHMNQEPRRVSLGPAASVNHPLRVREAGSNTTWPLRWLFSHLSPFKLAQDMAKFNLKLSTKLQFNEQARIVSHEDQWGLKEFVEFLSPGVLAQAYALQRRLMAILGDQLSQRYVTHQTRRQSIQTQVSFNEVDHSNDFSLHSPIAIGHPKPRLDRQSSSEGFNRFQLNHQKKGRRKSRPVNKNIGNESTSEDEYDSAHEALNNQASDLLWNPSSNDSFMIPGGTTALNIEDLNERLYAASKR